MAVKVIKNEVVKTSKGQEYTKVVVSSHKPVAHVPAPIHKK
ncbi:hypothetical protein [Paenibacillus roseipurpureus]|uniref:Uncharacterized protein n=1 Tax=Paenibacillus roseopurpureus TaxID=2918901 RepID=A0AA96LX74_9BACL|nr:hypothetical protein [Paenibacillus sp. MBLB1832]WNR46270.1 hypothetical protein MJB10_09295 [Paenibacillus sp. MBLB1832]